MTKKKKLTKSGNGDFKKQITVLYSYKDLIRWVRYNVTIKLKN